MGINTSQGTISRLCGTKNYPTDCTFIAVCGSWFRLLMKLLSVKFRHPLIVMQIVFKYKNTYVVRFWALEHIKNVLVEIQGLTCGWRNLRVAVTLWIHNFGFKLLSARGNKTCRADKVGRICVFSQTTEGIARFLGNILRLTLRDSYPHEIAVNSNKRASNFD